jgi:hypothetical protein
VPSRGVRHWPTVDHEAVVDLEQLLCLVILLFVVVMGPATFRRWPDLVKVALCDTPGVSLVFRREIYPNLG